MANCTIRPRENGLGDVCANLAPVHIERSDGKNVTWSVAAQVPIHYPRCRAFAIPLIVAEITLHYGTCAIPDANNGDTNRPFVHCRYKDRTEVIAFH